MNEKNEDSKVVDKPTDSVGSTAKELKVLPEGQSKKLIETIEDSVTIQKLGVIEQIDGQS